MYSERSVKCPQCGKTIKTRKRDYFKHCDKRYKISRHLTDSGEKDRENVGEGVGQKVGAAAGTAAGAAAVGTVTGGSGAAVGGFVGGKFGEKVGAKTGGKAAKKLPDEPKKAAKVRGLASDYIKPDFVWKD